MTRRLQRTRKTMHRMITTAIDLPKGESEAKLKGIVNGSYGWKIATKFCLNILSLVTMVLRYAFFLHFGCILRAANDST